MKKEKENIAKELERISPSLSRMKQGKSGFTVPENYFQNLTEEIMEKVRSAPAPDSSTSTPWFEPLLAMLRLALQPRYAAALSGIAILVVISLFWLRQPAPGAAVAWSDISTEEMTAYVADNLHEFAVEELIELAPGVEGQSILSGSDIKGETLDGYLEEILEEMEMEDLENLF